MKTELWTAVISGIVALGTLILKQHYNHIVSSKKQDALSDLITDKDEKQDAETAKLTENVEKLTERIEVIYNYIDTIDYKRKLINKLISTSNYIINVNNLDNVELITLLNNTRDKYSELISRIIECPVKELNIEDIRTDIKTFVKNIKMVTRFENIDVPDISDLKGRLKQEVITPSMNIFTMRLKDEIITDGNKYNGTFEKIVIGVISTLMTDIIKIYREKKIK